MCVCVCVRERERENVCVWGGGGVTVYTSVNTAGSWILCHTGHCVCYSENIACGDRHSQLHVNGFSAMCDNLCPSTFEDVPNVIGRSVLSLKKKKKNDGFILNW